MLFVAVLLCLGLLAPDVWCKSTQNKQEEAPPLDLGELFTKRQDTPILGGPSSREKDTPILGGPSSRQNEVDLDSLFGRDSGIKLKRSSDTFVETVKAAAAEFNAKRELGERTDARNVVTCVYCDSRCEAEAENAGYATANDYFQTAIDQMNTIVQAGLDENMTFELEFVLLPNSVTEMSWFFDYSATSSEELLTAINNKFWKDSGLYAMANSNGCAIDFLAAAPSDPAWGYMGSVEGIANMFQLCQASFSTIRMSSNPTSLAKLMVHEFGHMLGIYHDGIINVAFTSMESYFGPGQLMEACTADYAALSASCTASDVGCPSGHCVMASTVDGEDYSECSKAYYGMFNCLVEIMPTFYSDACTKN